MTANYKPIKPIFDVYPKRKTNKTGEYDFVFSKHIESWQNSYTKANNQRRKKK